MTSCIIIGAGIAGLTAARALQAQGWSVVVLDKGRGVGGRMATRRIDDGVFDHGAQFFTARDPRFQKWVDSWLAEGIIAEWTRGFANASGEIQNDGRPRYRGTNGMTSIAKHLAKGLDIRLDQKVTDARVQNGRWEARTENETFTSDTLILTPPVPQSLALLDIGQVTLPEKARAALDVIDYHRCIAVMVLLHEPSGIPAPGGIQINDEPIAWIGDNFQKGISSAYGATIHAAPIFSRTHWETDTIEVAHLLVEASEKWISADVKKFEVQRWRYSQPMQLHNDSCILVDSPAPLVFAGDAFAGPRVEGAALSGLAAAEKLLKSVK
jgi:renalase